MTGTDGAVAMLLNPGALLGIAASPVGFATSPPMSSNADGAAFALGGSTAPAPPKSACLRSLDMFETGGAALPVDADDGPPTIPANATGNEAAPGPVTAVLEAAERP